MAFGFKRSKTVEKPVDWPSIGDAVWLRLPCCDSVTHPSIVTGYAPDQIFITAPSKPHPETAPIPDPSRMLILGWDKGTDSQQMRVKFVSASPGPETWVLRSVSDVNTVQRRRYFRTPWERQVVLHLPGLGGAVTGAILDFSEGGLRCSFPAMDQPPWPKLEISFDLAGEPVSVEAEIAWWGRPLGGQVEAGLSFLVEEPAFYDRMRAHAFKVQQESRSRED